MTVAPQSAIYKITASLTPFGLEVGDRIEVVEPNFYDDGNLVLARKNDCLVLGKLLRTGSRFRVQVPAFGGNAEQNYYVDRNELLGIASKVERPG